MLRQTHSLCLLQRSEYARLYEILGKYLAEGYAVIYVAEPDPDKVLERMARAGIDVERYVKSGTLQVMPRDSIYVSDDEKNLVASKTIESWQDVISRIMNDTGAKGALAVGSVDTFVQDGQQERVQEYEENIGKRFQTLMEAVCCYNADSLSDTSVSALIAILNAHEYTIHHDAKYSEWKGDKLQNVLTSAFNKVLGSTTSDLMLKTLKSVYKIDEKAIISDPALLENAVGKFFKDSSPAILAAVLKDLKTEIAFHRQAPTVSAS
jgi:hypothetical protein